MAFNFLWNDPKVLDCFISQGREFHTDDPLYLKQFWLCLEFNLGDNELKLELHRVQSALSPGLRSMAFLSDMSSV